jgi:hypothetical protein
VIKSSAIAALGVSEATPFYRFIVSAFPDGVEALLDFFVPTIRGFCVMAALACK